MARQVTLYGIAFISILIVLGGFISWTFVNSSKESNSVSPSTTSNPYTSGDENPNEILIPNNSTDILAPTDLSKINDSTSQPLTIEQIRDLAILYIQANHFEIAALLTSFSWTGGRVSTGLVGAESYLFTSSGWIVSLQYPVIPTPVYTIAANHTDGTVYWVGVYENGLIKETFFTLSNNAQLGSGEEQARDAAMMFIKTNHTQTAPLMPYFEWVGGKEDITTQGTDSFVYISGSWTVALSCPAFQNPTYSIEVCYLSVDISIAWTGTYKSGVVTETSYFADFPTPIPIETPTPTPSPTPIPTSSPTPTPTLSPTPTPTRTPSSSPTPTSSLTPSPTVSPTPTRTPTPSPNSTATPSPSPTPIPTPPASTRLQVLNATMTNIKANHPQVPNIPAMNNWTEYILGGGVYRFISGGWNVTMRWTPIPQVYNMTVLFVEAPPPHQLVLWTGTYTGMYPNGVITQSRYNYTP